jgi:hypothetical protein
MYFCVNGSFTYLMCKRCFDKNIYSFPTRKTFERFQRDLTGRLTTGALLPIALPPDMQGDMHGDALNMYEPTSAYQCSACGETWYLSEPDHGWRGYFVTQLSLKPYLRRMMRSDGKRNVAGFILLAGLTLLMLILLTRC